MFFKKKKKTDTEGKLVIETILKVASEMDRRFQLIEFNFEDELAHYSCHEGNYYKYLLAIRQLRLRVARFANHEITKKRLRMLDSIFDVLDNIREAHKDGNLGTQKSVDFYRTKFFSCCSSILEREQRKLE